MKGNDFAIEWLARLLFPKSCPDRFAPLPGRAGEVFLNPFGHNGGSAAGLGSAFTRERAGDRGADRGGGSRCGVDKRAEIHQSACVSTTIGRSLIGLGPDIEVHT